MTDKPKDDNQQVVADLEKMIDESVIARGRNSGLPAIDKPKLMQSLVIYVVRRTHLGWDLGYKKGVEDGKSIERGDLEPEEES